MRIGWIVPGYQGNADEPGIPALTLLAQELARENDLHIFTIRFPPRDLRYSVAGVPVTSFGAGSVQGNRFQSRAASIARWIKVFRAIRAEHRRAPFAVLHGFWATEPGMLACAAGRLLGIPVVVSVCGGELASVRAVGYGNHRNRLERAQIAFALHFSSAIGVGSEDTHSRLAARYPWLADKTSDLPLGFDPVLFRPAFDASPSSHIVSVASWSPVKGHALLLDAVRLLRDWGHSPRLVLVGERTDGPAARKAVADRNLEECVELLGYQPRARVADLLREARMSVITSWHEAQCLAVVESLACGTPVVSTPVGIARTLLIDPRVGVIVPNRTPRQLALALQGMFTAADRETAADRSFRVQSVAYLAAPHVAERFQSCFERMVDKRIVVASP